MSRLLHKGNTLIEEYLSLIEELYEDEKEIKMYLKAKGVKL